MNLIKTYIDAMETDLHAYQEREDLSINWLIKRINKYKTDFHQMYNLDFHENRKLLAEFDNIHKEFMESIIR